MKKSLVFLMSLWAFTSTAYEYSSGDWVLKSTMGESVYFVADTTTRVNNNVALGFEFDYLFAPEWSLGGGFRPLFANNLVALNFAVTGKYRFIVKDTPLVPYVSLGLISSVLVSAVEGFKSHFNLGLRPAVGFEYFVARNLALGLECGMTPSLVWGGTTNSLESTLDLVAGVSWKV